MNITISDWAIVLATLLGPILAVQTQKWIEKLREARSRQEWIFRTLMSTRRARLSFDHVRALNMIPMDFVGQGNKVTQAWKIYLDHLNLLGPEPSPEVLTAWSIKNDDLFNSLLLEMAQELRYKFDPVELKREIYSPVAHGEQERIQLLIQKKLADILTGNDALAMRVTSVPVDETFVAQQAELNRKLGRYLDGETPVRVKLEKATTENISAS
jgi:hypothetical protein